MANYPLKKIAIGGDTYEIQGGSKSYRVMLQASLNIPQSISGLTVKEILDTYASSVNWDVIDITCLEDGTTYDPSLVMIDDLDGIKYYYASYDFYGSGVHDFGNFINWQPDDEQASNVMFGIGDYNSAITGLVSVSVDNQTNIVGNMLLSNFGGGGGGGSNIVPLHVLRNNTLVALTSLTAADTVTLINDNNVALDMTAVEGLLSQGLIPRIEQIGSPTPNSYTNIIDVDVVNNKMTLFFANGSNTYILALYNAWSTNWQVQLLQKIMTT